MIGRNSAVAEVGKSRHELTGPIAFAVWLGVHALLLATSRAKVKLLSTGHGTIFTGRMSIRFSTALNKQQLIGAKTVISSNG